MTSSTDLARLKEEAVTSAELHAEWTHHRNVRKDSPLANAVAPLLDEYLRARAANAAAALEKATR